MLIILTGKLQLTNLTQPSQQCFLVYRFPGSWFSLSQNG